MFAFTDRNDFTSQIVQPIQFYNQITILHALTKDNQNQVKAMVGKIVNQAFAIVVPIIDKTVEKSINRQYYIVLVHSTCFPEMMTAAVEKLKSIKSMQVEVTDLHLIDLDYEFCHYKKIKDYVNELKQDKQRFPESFSDTINYGSLTPFNKLKYLRTFWLFHPTCMTQQPSSKE